MTLAETAYGQLRGTEIADGIIAWRGVPYTRPPVGELRLRPPQPPEPWSGVRDAATYGGRSLQPEPVPDPSLPPVSEDCLYLNVTAPAGAAGRPVLLWVHGGGYEMGDGLHQAGDGAAFARTHGIVVVTFNYRLGALGFLDVPGEQPAGALGLHDQIAALRWTRENIAAFGGDPDQITVYGLSAGGKSVTTLLASPLTTGMIRRAAESSGGDHVKSRPQAARIAAEFFRALGTTPERVRSVPAADILGAQLALGQPPRSAWIWRPSVDGAALTSHPLTAIANGAAAGVPLLLQTCARECAYYQVLTGNAGQQADRVLAEYFGAQTREKLFAAYAADYPELDDIALRVAIMTDERYIIRTGRHADAQSVHAPVWRSRYDGPYSGQLADPRLAPHRELLDGAHGADGVGIWEGGDGVAANLHDAWGAFATTGDPGWERYTAVSRRAMIFGQTGPYLADDPFAPAREAWGTLDWQPSAWWSDH
jgi:para-nitrobenzyl esterase